MINIFVVSGNLGGDIDIRFTPNGKCIGDFSIPVQQGYGDHQKTSWISCKLLGDRAEKLAPYLVKGSLVTVTGEFFMETWEKNGVKNSKPCLLIRDLQLPPKTEATTFKPIEQKTKPQSPVLSQEELDALSDDIPF